MFTYIFSSGNYELDVVGKPINAFGSAINTEGSVFVGGPAIVMGNGAHMTASQRTDYTDRKLGVKDGVNSSNVIRPKERSDSPKFQATPPYAADTGNEPSINYLASGLYTNRFDDPTYYG